MNNIQPIIAALMIVLVSSTTSLSQSPTAPRLALNLLTGYVTNAVVGSSSEVTIDRVEKSGAITVAVAPGKDPYPGITLRPDAGGWDFSGFGHVEAHITNLGTNQLNISLRIDNAGSGQEMPWNTESCRIKSGTSGIVRVCFGYSSGKPGYALNSAAVIRTLLFASKSGAQQSWRIDSLVADGVPGEKPLIAPESIRIVPPNGILFGGDMPVNVVSQIVARGAQVTLTPAMRIVFPMTTGEASVSYRPLVGRWDLRQNLEVRVRLKNIGAVSVTPRVRLDSNGGPSDWIAAHGPLTPGASQELVIPFAARVPWTILPSINNTQGKVDGVPGTGTKFWSDAVQGVRIAVDAVPGERVLQVDSICAGMPPVALLPDWLGKRPPVSGDWTLTFADEFDGPTINTNFWNVYGENYYEKRSHYSRDNVIVGGGGVRLRYEKKRGWHNDDPNFKGHGSTAVSGETDYATGYLDSFGKWTQRYGYFESRMKLPAAPGLWPAFWMMPDRGPGVAKRGSTSNGGMEFDIVEQLTRWGPYRYNIAMHWDDYGKDHKNAGTSTIYVQPDREGYITAGLLWLPGLAVYYCNGIEVLRWEDPRISNVPSYLMYTLPSGGWDNDAIDDKKLPADYVIDYVRVWQRKDLATTP